MGENIYSEKNSEIVEKNIDSGNNRSWEKYIDTVEKTE